MDRETILATIAALAASLSDDDRAALAKQISPPVTHPTPEFSDDVGIQIMRLSGAKKSEPEKSTGHIITAFVPNVHSLALSEEVQTALDIIRWCLSVPKLRPDSPRFNYYVSRWLVLEKIEIAKENGTFDATTKDAGPIDPAWLHLIPAALVEYEKFAGQHCLKSCHDAPQCNNVSKNAALFVFLISPSACTSFGRHLSGNKPRPVALYTTPRHYRRSRHNQPLFPPLSALP